MPDRTLLTRLVSLGAFVLLFLVAVELITLSVAWVGEGAARTLLASTGNPFVGLFIGILATALVQSSSVTTTLAVGLVAGGGLPLASAVPIVIGANVGTSVTNTIVALGSISRPREFRLAVEAATVHDFFNLLLVALLFPLELAFHVLSQPAAWLTEGIVDAGVRDWMAHLAPFTQPLIDIFRESAGRQAWVVLAFGALLLVMSMRQIVRLLRGLVLTRTEGILSAYVFRSLGTAVLWGIVLTVLVQSSSVTTSLTVPLVAASALTVRQTYPFIVGANVGTTVTAMLVALVALPSELPVSLAAAALHLGLVHVCFNVGGLALLLPVRALREIPIRAAEALGRIAEHRRYVLGLYIAATFLLIPVMAITITNHLRIDYDPPTPVILDATADSLTGRSLLVQPPLDDGGRQDPGALGE